MRAIKQFEDDVHFPLCRFKRRAATPSAKSTQVISGEVTVSLATLARGGATGSVRKMFKLAASLRAAAGSLVCQGSRTLGRNHSSSAVPRVFQGQQDHADLRKPDMPTLDGTRIGCR